MKLRLKIRKFPYELPMNVYNEAKEHYFDKATGHNIAVKKVKINDKIKELAVTYDELKDRIEIVTIHPLKLYQKAHRIKSGRWRKL